MRGRRVSNDPLVGSAATKRAEYNVSKMRKAAQKSMPMSSVGNQFRERLHTFGLFFGPLPKRFHKSLLCRYQVFNFSSPPQFFGSVNNQIFPPHKVLSQIVFVVPQVPAHLNSLAMLRTMQNRGQVETILSKY